MLLDSVLRKYQIVLTTAKTTLDMPVIVSYVDDNAPMNTFTSGVYPTSTNGVTVVDMLPAPAANTQRKINSISIYNKDTAAKTVQISLLDNVTSYSIIDIVLQIDDTLCFTDTRGWFVVRGVNQNYTITFPVKLGQAALPTTVGTLYTVPALTRTKVKDIDICNTSTSQISATVYLVPSGGTAGAGNILIPSVPIQPASVGGMFQWSGTQILNAGDTIQILGSALGLTINASGEEAV